MYLIGGIIVLIFVAWYLGPIFWLLLFLGLAGFFCWVAWEQHQESPRTQEERERQRLYRDEERHAARMARISYQHDQSIIEAQLAAQQQADASSTKNKLWGAAGKLALGVGLSALTGGAHKHRH